jgi:hypothetical protein
MEDCGFGRFGGKCKRLAISRELRNEVLEASINTILLA